MPHIRGAGRYGRPNYGQAAHIIKKFGGEVALAKLLGISRITLYRWNYSRPLGTDGLVPHAQRPKIEALARYEGILLLPSDWETTRIKRDDEPEVIHAVLPGKTLEELLS
jgi:hypothetical protein